MATGTARPVKRASVRRQSAIISLEEFVESINMVVYGDSGAGKTVLAGTAPRALFLATETGSVSAARRGSKAKLWKIRTWNDLQLAYDYLVEHPDEFDWIVIDSVTAMQKLCMRAVLEAAAAASRKGRAHDIDVMEIQDWPKYYNMFGRFLTMFNDLPINVLYTATTMRKEDENGEELVLPELIGPSHSPLRESMALCASVAIVTYLKTSVDGKGKDSAVTRELLFNSFPPYFAKDRLGIFPRWVKVAEGDRQITGMDAITRKINSTGSRIKPKAAPAKVSPIKAAPVKAAVTPVKATPVKATATSRRQA